MLPQCTEDKGRTCIPSAFDMVSRHFFSAADSMDFRSLNLIARLVPQGQQNGECVVYK